MRVDNVTQILNKIISGGEWEKVMDRRGLNIPKPLVKEIQRRHIIKLYAIEKNHACADYYVNCHPEADWGHLTMGLYWKAEFAAARESKIFMSTGKYCTINQVEYHRLLYW
jgi:hypothetical protein